MINKIFSQDDKLYLPLYLVSLGIISFLIGDFFKTFFLAMVITICLGLVVALIEFKKFDIELWKKTKHILTFSILVTLIFANIWPYIIFHNSFLGIYAVLYLYAVPILLLFFMSFSFFSALLFKHEFHFKHALKVSLIITVIISLILSLTLLIIVNNIHRGSSNSFYRSYEDQMELLSGRILDDELEIFNEINEYQTSFISDAETQVEKFEEFDLNKGKCLRVDCFKEVGDKSIFLIHFIINGALLEGTINDANAALEFIESENYTQNYSSVDEYKTALRDEIDSFEFVVYEMSEEEKERLEFIESEFNYKEIKTYLDKVEMDSRRLFVYDLFWSPSDPIFKKSYMYAGTHVAPYRQLIRLFLAIQNNNVQFRENPELFRQIYENIEAEESDKSKIVRYRIILHNIKNIERRRAERKV